jgi:hypothetical protein
LGKVGVRKPAICLEGCYDAPINRVEVRFWHLRLLSMPLSAESTKIFAKNGSDRNSPQRCETGAILGIDGGWRMPAPVTPEHEDESFAEQEAVAATLDRYIRGAQTGDVALMRLAFAETARISGTYGGKPVEWTVEEFCSLIGKGGPAEGLQAQAFRNLTDPLD